MRVSDSEYWTASTFSEAMGIILSPKNKMTKTILHKNSLKWWRQGQYDLDDALAEMLSYIVHQHQTPEAQVKFLRMFNSGQEYNQWMVRYCQNQLNNNKSIAFRKYYTNRFNDDNKSSTEMVDLQDQPIDAQEEKESDVRSYCGKDQLTIMIQLLSSKEAKSKFHQEQLDLFYWFFLSDPECKVPLISDIAKEVNITRLAAYRLIMPVKKFLSQKMKHTDSVKGYLFRSDKKTDE